MAEIISVKLMVGLEIHIELSTRTKMFSRAPSPAWSGPPGPTGQPDHDEPEPNTCIDPLVLGLPGSLPVLNREAVERCIRVGLALGCQISKHTGWDRKSYFYPDMPKNYQISQYDLPLCFDGVLELPLPAEAQPQPGGPIAVDWDGGTKRIGIIRAHLEEDAGKLLHEAPGGAAIVGSIVDLNRAGTPLLEIVTQPDFETADEVVLFCQTLRNLCRFLGVTQGVLQKGHIRFEPNINTIITFDDGRVVRTPVVEVKNLNSYKAVRGAIEFERYEQPARWKQDGREMGPGTKATRGWDDQLQRTFVQREKEDAHDYRYFPDPDLLPLTIDAAWVAKVHADLPELPLARMRRAMNDFGLAPKEAAVLVEERPLSELFDAATNSAWAQGVQSTRAGRQVANLLLQAGLKRANERGVALHELGLGAAALAAVAVLREAGSINAASADELVGWLAEPAQSAATAAAVNAHAAATGMILVRDDAALDGWVDAAIAEQAKAAQDVRAGKDAAVGRIVGAAMKLAGGRGDAKTLRERILARLGQA